MECVNFKKESQKPKARTVKAYQASIGEDYFTLHLEDVSTKERLYLNMNRREAINILQGFHYQLFGTILNTTEHGTDTAT